MLLGGGLKLAGGGKEKLKGGKRKKNSHMKNWEKKNLPAAISLDQNGGPAAFFALCAPASLTTLASTIYWPTVLVLEPYSQLPALLLHPASCDRLSPPCHFSPYGTGACTRKVQRTLLRLIGIEKKKSSELAQPICRDRDQAEYACTTEISQRCVYCP